MTFQGPFDGVKYILTMTSGGVIDVACAGGKYTFR